MAAQLDHLILVVNDRAASIEFYTQILGFAHEGEREPFSVIRVNDGLTLQLAPWGTTGGAHLAFALPRPEFDEAFARKGSTTFSRLRTTTSISPSSLRM